MQIYIIRRGNINQKFAYMNEVYQMSDLQSVTGCCNVRV
jgi:hypothetical protein